MSFSHRGGPILFLARLGYRYDTPSFQDVVDTRDVREVTYPYCTAIECAKGDAQVLKEGMTVWQRRCPDCGNALSWRDSLRPADERRAMIRACDHKWRVYGNYSKKHGLTFDMEACEKCRVPKDAFEEGRF